MIQNEIVGALNVQCNQNVCCLNPWDVQSKHVQPRDGIAEALYSGECRYGGGESYVLDEVTVLNDQGGGVMNVSKDQVGTLRAQEHGHAPIVMENRGGYIMTTGDFMHVDEKETAYTVSARDYKSPQVVYGISPDGSNAMKSSNPHSGIYEAETARTLDLNGGSPVCNQGGMAIVQGVDAYNGAVTGEVAASLNANSGTSANHAGPAVMSVTRQLESEEKDVSPTLTASDYKMPHSVMRAEPMPVAIEGNGTRESHMGDGYKESEVMFTLNTVEQHAVAYKVVGADGYNASETGDVAMAIRSAAADAEHVPLVIEPKVYENHSQDTRFKELGDICQTVSATYGMGGNNQPLVVGEPKALSDVAACRSAQDGRGGVHSQMLGNPEENFVIQSVNGDVAGTLDANYYKGCGERQGTEREVVCIGNGQVAQLKESPIAGTLNCMHEQQAIISYGVDSYNQSASEEQMETLRTNGGGDNSPKVCTYGLDRASYNQGKNAKFSFGVDEEMVGAQTAKGLGAVGTNVVRRLTPTECGRLQGYPDGWLDVGEWTDSKGKKHKEADAPKYKAAGNSIAIPFWAWLAERICGEYEGDVKMASLFDGIGGFPLAFSRAGAEPVWASEIEEFPIAVTKKHFPEHPGKND